MLSRVFRGRETSKGGCSDLDAATVRTLHHSRVSTQKNAGLMSHKASYRHVYFQPSYYTSVLPDRQNDRQLVPTNYKSELMLPLLLQTPEWFQT